MTKNEETTPPPAPGGSYRTCRACQCQVHRDLNSCPECGTPANASFRKPTHLKLHVATRLILLGFLGGSLVLLSRNSEEAREAERASHRILTTSESTGAGSPTDQTNPFVPQALPTPSPVPTPLPTVTPLAASPFPSVATPVPTSIPTPLPTATPPPPTPTPTPIPTILETKENIKAEMRTQLNQRAPLIQIGEQTTLSLTNNRTVSGILLRREGRQFQIQSTLGAQWVPYRSLTLESRLRIDSSEREAWLEERALEQVLQSL